MRPQAGGAGQPRGVSVMTLAVPAQAPGRWPGISACLIVRNEAANIQACLASLGDLAAETIVVDTGSTDDTVAVAQSLGAQVYHFEWIGDFAAARNESLRRASQPWVFWLDADDRLTVEAVAQLKNAAACGLADAYACSVSSRLTTGGLDVARHIRLFRNGRGIQFSGAIHETLWPALEKVGTRLADTNITIQHLGYAGSAELMAAKFRRNAQLIEQELAARPDDLDLHYYLGQCLAGLDERERARDELNYYLAHVPLTSGFNYKRFWAHAGLARVFDTGDRWPELEAAVVGALAEFPKHPYFMTILGKLDLDRGRPDQALPVLLEAYEQEPGSVQGYQPPPGWTALSIAQCYQALGQPQEALAWARRARAGEADPVQVGKLLAKLHMEAGQYAEAEAVIRAMMPDSAGPDPWLVLAELRRLQGRFAEADEAVQEAGKHGLTAEQTRTILARLKSGQLLMATKTQSTQASLAQIQGMTFLAADDHLKAAESFAEAIDVAPEDPDNYRYLAVALEKLGQTEQALEAWRLARYWARQAVAAAG